MACQSDFTGLEQQHYGPGFLLLILLYVIDFIVHQLYILNLILFVSVILNYYLIEFHPFIHCASFGSEFLIIEALLTRFNKNLIFRPFSVYLLL